MKEKKSYVTFFSKKNTIFTHDYVLGFSRKNKTLLNLLFNSRVNLNNAMKRIVCDLCMPRAFFTGTFNCLAKKKFFTQDCEN